MSVLSYRLAISNKTLNVNDKTLINFDIQSVFRINYSFRHDFEDIRTYYFPASTTRGTMVELSIVLSQESKACGIRCMFSCRIACVF